MAETEDKKIKELLLRAKKCPNKGRLYVYEGFKQELIQMNVSPQVYEQTCRELGKCLKVLGVLWKRQIA